MTRQADIWMLPHLDTFGSIGRVQTCTTLCTMCTMCTTLSESSGIGWEVKSAELPDWNSTYSQTNPSLSGEADSFFSCLRYHNKKKETILANT